MSYQGRPFEWDLPNNEEYPQGVIRVLFRDASGAIISARPATDEEVRTVMLLHAVILNGNSAVPPASVFWYDSEAGKMPNPVPSKPDKVVSLSLVRPIRSE